VKLKVESSYAPIILLPSVFANIGLPIGIGIEKLGNGTDFDLRSSATYYMFYDQSAMTGEDDRLLGSF